MMDESDHDILIEIRRDLKHHVEDQQKLETRIFGDDGQGGLCGEVEKLKTQQFKWLGRDGAIITAITVGISALALFLKGGS